MPNQNVNLNVSAKTVDEAIEVGLAQLGLPREQVEVEVINEGKRGLFGLGAEDATVRLVAKQQVEAPIEDTPVEPPPVETETQVSSPQPVASPDTVPIEPEVASPVSESGSEEAVDAEQPAESNSVTLAREHLENLLKHMGIEATIETRAAPELVEGDEEAPTVLDIQGKDLGILIGRRSETLQALQYLVRLMASKEMGSWQRVVVDVESYRSRRRQSLQKMARRMAERAVTNDERVVLESMSAYERRIVHLTLRDHPDVFTKSVGADKNRKVTIIPK